MRLTRRGRIRASVSIGAVALAASLGFAGAAQAVPVPPFPAASSFGTAPLWWNSNGVDGSGNAVSSISNIVRSAGSDTTLFMMQAIGDLYNDAGLYGCAPNSTAISNTGNTSFAAESACLSTGDLNVTDEVDNFTRTEVLNEIGDIGSSAGQDQLCGTNILADPNGPPEFARSSSPLSSSPPCTGLVELGFAKDSVPAIDFPTVSPGEFGAATWYTKNGDDGSGADANGATAGVNYFEPAGNTVTPPNFPTNGLVGPVAAGWLPGDPLNCTASVTASGSTLSGTHCSGTPLIDIPNGNVGATFVNTTTGAITQSGTATGVDSAAYRLFCLASNAPNRIYDWGQLTNLSAANNVVAGVPTQQPVGSGTPIGIPIRIADINPSSGTNGIFGDFANQGTGSSSNGICTGSTKSDENAASGPDPDIADGPTGNTDQIIENNASQIGSTANEEFNTGSTSSPAYEDNGADAAVEVATTLSYISFGAYNETTDNGNSTQSTIDTNTTVSGVPSTYTAQLLQENGVYPSISKEGSNAYPTARTLFNIYNTATVTASTAGFLNWVCDSNAEIKKGTDLVTGQNYDNLLNNIIGSQYGFLRLTDVQPELASPTNAGDGQPAPNGSCDASITVNTAGTSSAVVTYAPGGVVTNVPSGVHVGATVTSSPGSTDFPSATITAISGSSITLSVNDANAAATGETLYLPGTAPVLAVENVKQ
jgi:hypothetical protein